MSSAWIFPGQGTQYPGMGRDFYENFSIAKHTFHEADDLLEKKLSTLILKGPEDELTKTSQSQLAIYVVSIALMRVLKQESDLSPPTIVAGLSLGEYSALTAAGYLDFAQGLKLVQKRGELMSNACDASQGGMAVVLGLSLEGVKGLLRLVNLPNDLWIANINCPGQIVLSGTKRGIESAIKAGPDAGARRMLPLQVHGAFHSPLMESAKEGLRPFIEEVILKNSLIPIYMNVTGESTTSTEEIKKLLVEQVTAPVLWESTITKIETVGVDHYFEIGPGKTLAGFNKRIGTKGPTTSIDSVASLQTVVGKG